MHQEGLIKNSRNLQIMQTNKDERRLTIDLKNNRNFCIQMTMIPRKNHSILTK